MDENKKTEFAAEKSAKTELKRPQGEKKRSINIVDIVLILIILAVILTVLFAFAPNANLNLNSTIF